MRVFLDEPWLVFGGVCIALFLSSVLGYRIAVLTGVNEDSHQHEHITGLREGLFVLLGLLLGFTIAVVLPRFDERRHLVVEEANAIGTTILRAEILPEPQRGKSLELLRQYAVVRHEFAKETLLEASALSRETQHTKVLQEQLWQQLVSVTQVNQTAVMATYLQALNDTIDVSEKRLAAFESRVPTSVWLIIFVVAAFHAFVNGFSLKQKFWFSLLTAPLVIGVVMALLADLDSPHTGFIRIEQNSMERLVNDVTNSKQ